MITKTLDKYYSSEYPNISDTLDTLLQEIMDINMNLYLLVIESDEDELPDEDAIELIAFYYNHPKSKRKPHAI